MFILAAGFILLDYSSQAAINPCEALMSDILHSSTNENTGFLVYSGMLSLGSCIGYLLSALNWNKIRDFFSRNDEIFKKFAAGRSN